MSPATQFRPVTALLVLLGGLFATALLGPTAVADVEREPDTVTVTYTDDENGDTFEKVLPTSALLVGSIEDRKISGLGDLVVDGTYNGNPQLLTASGTLYYAINTDDLSPDGPSIPLEDPDNPALAGTHHYQGVLEAADLANAFRVRFMIELEDLTGAIACDKGLNAVEQNACDDAAANQGFTVELDQTRPELDLDQPDPEIIEDLGKAVTTDIGRDVTLVLVDAPTDTHNASFHLIKRTVFDGPTNVTAEFPITAQAAQPTNEITMKRTAALPSPNTDITYTVGIRDLAGNFISTTAGTPNTYTIHVDTTAPVIDQASIEATPETVVPDSDPPVTGLGVRVEIQATITDEPCDCLDTSATADDVTVTISNTTALNAPVTVFMTFNNSNDKFSGNVTLAAANVKSAFQDEAFNVTATVNAKDVVANAALAKTLANAYIIDPVGPEIEIITPDPLPTHAAEGPYEFVASVADTSAGVDEDSIVFHIRNETGAFDPGDDFDQVAGTDDEWKAPMTEEDGNWTVSVPDQDNGVELEYNITAKDLSGNEAETAVRSFTIDKQAPRLDESNRKTFRGPLPHRFTFTTFDPGANGTTGSGVNASSGKLFYRVSGGAYTTLNMTHANNLFNASITSATFQHNQVIEYYAEAADRVGNEVTNGTAAAPKEYTVDLELPTTTFSAPPPSTSDTGTFTMGATAQDADSGVDKIVFEGRFRTETGTFGPWLEIHRATPSGSPAGVFVPQKCYGVGLTWEFRAFAIDVATNVGTPTEARTTVVGTPGCQVTATITIQQPTARTSIDAEGGTRHFTIQWTLASGSAYVLPALFTVRIEFSPDDGVHFVRIGEVNGALGSFDWVVAAPSCDDCRIRLVATPPSGNATTQASQPFSITDGKVDTDFDGNGLFDECELTYFGGLGRADADADPDDDGLDNADECGRGTIPTLFDSDGDGFGDGVEVRTGHDPLDPSDKPDDVDVRFEQWDISSPYQWIVVFLFVAVTVLFFLGVSRRW